ncbi:ABC transporter substrate-binding protein [Anaerosporobacter faecicola]|uniref:ABC transporter substrate-binding protein n=1 Tax=Anaerosporobacter faecicola TaxID=2718714 RepID=UPI00143AB9EE|nr:ABC transporter substrate-binding protein [Anaerosporobacter faecicola]
MQKSRKKLRYISIALTAILTFSGCGLNSADRGSASNETTEAQYAKYLDDEVSIDFECIWAGTDSKAEYVANMISSFNEKYKGQYHVNVIEQTDYNTYESKLSAQIKAGQVPDVFTMKNYGQIKEYAAADKLMDFSTYLGQGDRASRYATGVLDEYKDGNKMCCIPYESGVVPIMYDMALLNSVGIQSIPTSWEEFFQTCDTLKEKGIDATSFMTGSNAWTAQLWFSYAVAATVGQDAWKGDMTSDAYEKAAKIVKKIYSYSPPDAIGAEAATVNQHFFNKETAIYTNGTWILGGIRNNAGQEFYDQVQVSPGLSYEEMNGNSFISYIQAFICAAKQEDPKKQEAVEAFIDHITDTANVTGLSEASGATFCINVDTSKITDPLQGQIINGCKNADFTIRSFESSVPSDTSAAFPKALEQYVTNQISVQEFLNTLQSPPKNE